MIGKRYCYNSLFIKPSGRSEECAPKRRWARAYLGIKTRSQLQLRATMWRWRRRSRSGREPQLVLELRLSRACGNYGRAFVYIDVGRAHPFIWAYGVGVVLSAASLAIVRGPFRNPSPAGPTAANKVTFFGHSLHAAPLRTHLRPGSSRVLFGHCHGRT